MTAHLHIVDAQSEFHHQFLEQCKRRSLARGQLTCLPLSVLDMLQRDPSESVRQALSANPDFTNLPAERIELALRDPSSWARTGLAINPLIHCFERSINVPARLAKDSCPFVRQALAHSPALTLTADHEMIAMTLANDPEDIVRDGLARNKRLGDLRNATDVAVALLAHGDLGVGNNIKGNLSMKCHFDAIIKAVWRDDFRGCTKYLFALH